MNELVSEYGVILELGKALPQPTASRKVQEVFLPHTFSFPFYSSNQVKIIDSKHDRPHTFPTLYPFALPQ
jgi:hypothetical protein